MKVYDYEDGVRTDSWQNLFVPSESVFSQWKLHVAHIKSSPIAPIRRAVPETSETVSSLHNEMYS
jgi:hypothetical protein